MEAQTLITVAAAAANGQNSPLLEGFTGHFPDTGRIIGAIRGCRRMPIFLFFVGAIAVAAGVGMIGYGIPVREFSFGNTLIIAGTTAAVGGLVLIGVGAVVSQLRRIAETLAAQPVSSRRPFETFEPPAGPRAAPMSNRMPGPPGKPQSEGRKLPPAMDASAPAAIRGDNRPASVPAPKLQNPDREGATGQEVESRENVGPPPARVGADEPAPPLSWGGNNPPPATEPRSGQEFEAPWQSPLPPSRAAKSSNFDSMWPADSRLAKRPIVGEAKSEPKSDMGPTPMPAAPGEPAAILKSGVVDGMGYTLYVDGSIEAELPQGTLRFASINELREHLAKN
jgi:hypothetical protein